MAQPQPQPQPQPQQTSLIIQFTFLNEIFRRKTSFSQK